MTVFTAPYVVSFDPEAFALGPLSIKWYGLTYVVGLLVGLWIARWYCRRTGLLTSTAVSDLITWIIGGIILGGRLGYAVAYQPQLLSHPLDLFKLWTGGMSFHGALLGIILSLILFARRHSVAFLRVSDMVAVAGTPGIFLGRMGNFINGELWGRPTDMPWGMIFPRSGDSFLARHPSQIYEGVLEGLVLFAVLYIATTRWHWDQQKGKLSGLFLLGYGVARSAVECVREPDAQLGLLWLGLTMGQWLTAPLIFGGLWLLFRRPDSTSLAK